MRPWAKDFADLVEGGLIKLSAARKLAGMSALGVHDLLSKLKIKTYLLPGYAINSLNLFPGRLSSVSQRRF